MARGLITPAICSTFHTLSSLNLFKPKMYWYIDSIAETIPSWKKVILFLVLFSDPNLSKIELTYLNLIQELNYGGIDRSRTYKDDG